MTIFLAALLASTQPLPFIDRASLDDAARIGALRGPSGRQSLYASPKKLLKTDMGMIATVCGAAGRLNDPATFLNSLAKAYALTREETSGLRETCAIYLAGRLDGTRQPR